MNMHRFHEQDPRINARRSFWREYLTILALLLVCCVGAVLMFNHEMLNGMDPWIMAVTIMSYVLFMGFLVSATVQIIAYLGFRKPMLEIALAAKKVASGDFTVRLSHKRRDSKLDEMEVLINDFNTMVEELSTIETMKTDFIANVSHEIKTPLAVIHSYSEALRNTGLPEEKRSAYIDTVLTASEKLSGLVSDILRLNKLEHQEIIKTGKFSLDEQLRCCLLAVEELMDEKNLDWQADLDEEIYIENDEALLEILWNNLLKNAIKFTDRGGTLKVSAHCQNHSVIVMVEDSGCGMDEETKRHLFDRFYQGDTSHASEGNGLGMAMAARIMQLTKSSITVDSTPGKGTCFSVHINKTLT